MIIQSIDQRIRRAFSNSAIQYDVLSSLHREIGRELTMKLRKLDIEGDVLDIGMGTGWFTNRLKHFFPEKKVIGIDFASGMIEQAKKRDEQFSIVQADAHHLPFQHESFGLITSNLAYQWVEDLRQALTSSRDCLKPNGHLVMTLFGHETFCELFTSLEEAGRQLKGKDALPFRRLITVDQIKQALEQSAFRNIEVDYERIRVRYPDLRAILKWIKDLGANALSPKFFLGKELLASAEEYYNSHFRDSHGIYTTFEIVWVKAQK